MQNHIALGGRGVRRGDSDSQVRSSGGIALRKARRAVFAVGVAALLIAAPSFSQQGPGRSVFAAAEEKSKEDKEKRKEERKEQKAEQRTQKKSIQNGDVDAGSPEPPPAPVVGQAPPLESDDESASTAEEEGVPAIEEVPPRPRVDMPTRQQAPSATVMEPPAEEPKGVVAEPPPPPPIPVDPNRPKNGEGERKDFYLDFQKQSLSEVIASIGPMIGKNFLLDPTVTTQEVTLITHAAIPPDMILPIFASVLNTYGFKMVDTADGNLVKILPIADGKDLALLNMKDDSQPTGYEGYQFQIVRVKHAAASEISQLLTEVGSKEAKVTVYERTNMLLLYGTEASIRKMMELIDEVDKAGFDEVVEFFTLEFTRAEVVAQQIQQVLMGDESQAGANAAPTGQPIVRQPAPVVRPSRPGQSGGAAATQQVIGAQALTLRITPDERLNALVVVASQPLMVRVRDLIEKLDSPTPPDSNNMHVRELQFADVLLVQEALQSLISGGGGGTRPGTRPGSTGRPGGTPGGAPAAVASGGAPGADVQPFEKSVIISAFEETNALLVVASPQDYKLLDSIIAQIDKPSRQVLVEAIIMEVAIGDQFRLAIESSGLTSSDYFALNNVVTLANVLTQGPLASLSGGDIFNGGIIDGTVDIQVPGAAGAASTTQTVNNVPLLIQALESLTALDVLSRPSVITVDNKEANVLDGQNIPIPSGSERNINTGGGTGQGSLFTTVQREDVGVKMKVTPQISEGNYVFLELDVEVSRPIQSTVGIDPNSTGVTLSKSNIITNAVVRDGSTGVLGGLISEGTDRSRRQTPILGDIPLLGSLFGRKDYNRTKRNLVVLITPHIVKEGIDYDRLTDAQMTKAAAANADVLFERGIIKKLPKKAKLRSKYRPTEATMNEIRGISTDTAPAALDRGTVQGEQ